ncbi:MAG: hypothetical protein HW411_184 [Gammaproteobacteria bacterium]|nr:hypothetical protein [Gammaproteobacteria bacterium]
MPGKCQSDDPNIDVHSAAKVAELADALVLGTSGATRESSSLSFRTNIVQPILTETGLNSLRVVEE